MVRRKFHDKGRRISGKHLCLLQHNAGNDDGCDSDEVRTGSHNAAAPEERACNEADDRHLGATGDKGGGHDRHTPVTFVLDGAGGHNTRHAAAHAYQHRDEALAGKTEAAENPVHDKRDTRHITAVLQDAEHQEQHQHLRDEAEHRTNTGKNTVGNQPGQPVGCTETLHNAAGAFRQPLAAQHIVGPVSQEAAEGPHGNPVNQIHDHCEDGQAQQAVCDDTVDLV